MRFDACAGATTSPVRVQTSDIGGGLEAETYRYVSRLCGALVVAATQKLTYLKMSLVRVPVFWSCLCLAILWRSGDRFLYWPFTRAFPEYLFECRTAYLKAQKHPFR